mmetsp:Transcript_85305/g.254293  ORF Transcript_85305/g.254293 Transcript_85305/m.254293 type:complete len:263 (+) Transcript_85305:424-1212(+)
MPEGALQDADQRVEGSQIEVHLGIPHVVPQLHRHERHHAAQKQHCLHPRCNGSLRIVDLLGERSVRHSRVEGLTRQDTKLHHLERHQAGFLQVPWRVLQHVAEHGHASVGGDQLQMLQDHQVHEGRECVGVIRGRREAIFRDSPDQRAIVLEVVSVPIQAKLEVHLVDLLPPHLRFHRVPRDAPLQARQLLRRDEARLRRQRRLVTHVPLPNGVRVAECLAKDLLPLEATVEVAGDEAESRLPVVLQVHQQIAELAGVDEGL